MSFKKQLLKLKDKVRFAIAKSLYDFKPTGAPEAFDFNLMEHVVILKNDAKLGDTEVMSHFYDTLRKAINSSSNKPLKLSVVCSKNLEPVYRDILKFDQVIVSSRKPKDAEIQNICKSIKDFNDGKAPDLVVSTETFFRKRDFLFCKNLNPKYIAGCDNRVQCISHLIYDIHSTDMIYQSFEKLMDKGHLKYEEVHYQKLFHQSNLVMLKESLNASLQNENTCLDNIRLIGVNPISTGRTRSFNAELTADIINTLCNFQNFKSEGDINAKNSTPSIKTKVLLLTPPGQDDFLKTVMSRVEKSSVLFLPQNSSALDYAASFDLIDALISVDTAAVHLASACDVKMMACYNGVDSETDMRWQPLQKESISFNKPGILNNELTLQDIKDVLYQFLAKV